MGWFGRYGTTIFKADHSKTVTIRLGILDRNAQAFFDNALFTVASDEKNIQQKKKSQGNRFHFDMDWIIQMPEYR